MSNPVSSFTSLAAHSSKLSPEKFTIPYIYIYIYLYIYIYIYIYIYAKILFLTYNHHNIGDQLYFIVDD